MNFKQLRSIPISEVVYSLGLRGTNPSSSTYFIKATPDNPDDPRGSTSLSIFEKTNTWKRWSGKQFGGVDSGSTIDLVMHIHDCSLSQATEWLSTYFPSYNR